MRRDAPFTREGPGFALLGEVWDHPPAWFDGAPDLRPTLRAVLTAALGEALSRPGSPEDRAAAALAAAAAALQALLTGPQDLLYAGSGASLGLLTWEGPSTVATWVGDLTVQSLPDGAVIGGPHTLPQLPGVLLRTLGAPVDQRVHPGPLRLTLGRPPRAQVERS